MQNNINDINDILTYDTQWSESIYKEIFLDKEYEYENIKVEENDIVLDLGANIGIFSLYAESKKSKHIYSFEPIKEYYEMLKENLKNYKNIQFFNSAISYKTGKSKIVRNFDNNTILTEVYDQFGIKNENKTEIDTLSINDFIDNIEKIDFMKLDIEGSEYDIFENITNYNLNKISKIVCEYHWNYENRLDKTIKILNANGFKVYTFTTNNFNKIGKLFALKMENATCKGKIKI